MFNRYLVTKTVYCFAFSNIKNILLYNSFTARVSLDSTYTENNQY